MDGQQPDIRTEASRRTLFQRARVVGLLTFLSRTLGLARDSCMAMLFGLGPILDAFTVAYRIPNMARQVFGEGALSTAFLPIFIRDRERSGTAAAFRTATAVLVATAVTLLVLVVVVDAALLVARGTLPLTDEAQLLLGLTATMLPYLMLVCVLAQACAVMHGLGEFSIPALFPVLLNAIWIIIAWLIGRSALETVGSVYLIAAAIPAIGVLQLVLCVPTLRRLGFRYEWDWASGRTRLGEIMRTMLPVILGLSITQFNTLCDSLIAWGLTAPSDQAVMGWLSEYPLSEGTAAALYYGQRLYQFPLGVFAVALGTVIFPLLTTHAERGLHDLFRQDLVRGLRMVIAIGIPASVGLFLIALPLTRLLFERGAFDRKDSDQTAGIIAMYAVGVWAACALLIVHRAFYALGDRMTPLRIGLLSVVINLAGSLALVFVLAGRGLALATSLTVTLQMLVCVWLLSRRVDGFVWQPVFDALVRTTVASALMAGACVVSAGLADPASGDTTWNRAMTLLIPLVSGGATYLLVARLLGLREPFDLLARRSTDDS